MTAAHVHPCLGTLDCVDMCFASSSRARRPGGHKGAEVASLAMCGFWGHNEKNDWSLGRRCCDHHKAPHRDGAVNIDSNESNEWNQQRRQPRLSGGRAGDGPTRNDTRTRGTLNEHEDHGSERRTKGIIDIDRP
ncbi:hypothetical protein L596_023942 [Steinernema carpocapsae]|uniref:Uncharacterized protein n=1 Tax=Steinernema carpocapsae TaxID=34508 RepID=A0A4U5MF83_STECR|nr:hypothetical protein L596_023942 [Steinernema carpocapsae]